MKTAEYYLNDLISKYFHIDYAHLSTENAIKLIAKDYVTSQTEWLSKENDARNIYIIKLNESLDKREYHIQSLQQEKQNLQIQIQSLEKELQKEREAKEELIEALKNTLDVNAIEITEENAMPHYLIIKEAKEILTKHKTK